MKRKLLFCLLFGSFLGLFFSTSLFGQCDPPTGLTLASPANYTQLHVTWTHPADLISNDRYSFRYRQTGTIPWTQDTLLGLDEDFIAVASVPGQFVSFNPGFCYCAFCNYLTTFIPGSVKIGGLKPCTSYETQIGRRCSATGTFSAYSAASFTTACLDQYYNGSCYAMPWDQFASSISEVDFDGDIFSLNAGCASCGGCPESEGFELVSTNVNLTKGSLVPLNIRLESGNGTSFWWQNKVDKGNVKAWIDFNKDFDFADGNEQVFNETATDINPTEIVSGSFSIPTNLAAGIYRMRIVFVGGNGANALACGGNFNAGKVVDFKLNITACPNPPTASITGPAAVCSGVANAFSASATGGTAPLSYKWSTGQTMANINQSFTANSTLTVTVTDAAGCTGSASQVISVNAAPTAAFTSSSNGLAVSFANGSTGATSYLWDFGDGQTSTTVSPSHTYALAGSYSVCLTATGNCGSMQTCQSLMVPNTTVMPPCIEWQNTIGGANSDLLTCLQQTTDGGYILGGFSSSNSNGDKAENSKGGNDYWVVKLDASGNVVWENTIGGSSSDQLRSIQQTTDGGYILGGSSTSGISSDKNENAKNNSNDYWIVKLDATGNITWQNTIGGNGDDDFGSIQQTGDGGYILGGSSISGISGDKTEASPGAYDYWIVKLNSTGSIVWQNTIGGGDSDFCNAIKQTTDGGYIASGISFSGISGDKTEASAFNDYWVVKLNSTGSIVWQNTIGGSGGEEAGYIRQTPDGGYILSGYSDSPVGADKSENSDFFDYWVIKLNSTGGIVWEKTLGGTGIDVLESTIATTADGGYLLAGISDSDISGDKTEASKGGTDFWVLKLNASGNILWQKTIGGGSSEGLTAVATTADGGIALGGFSASGITGDKTEANKGGNDYWVVKLLDCDLVCNRTSDSLALVDFFNATNGPSWTNKANWLVPGKAISTWYGVTASSPGCVTCLDLDGTVSCAFEPFGGNNLVGSLPDMKLPFLEKLFLRNNHVSGQLPEFSHLRRINEIDLTNNQLTGPIPNFQSLDSLKYLYMMKNNLNGQIPNFDGLPNLKYLYLWGNDLTDTVPDFQFLQNVETIELQNNLLTGKIPDFSLPKLQKLWLQNNKLSGSLPAFLLTPSINQLYVLNNKLSGPVPDLTHLNLIGLDISSNKFSSLPDLSSITTWMSGFNNQDGLHAGNNALTFDDIVPNLPISQAYFSYAPQSTVFHDTTLTRAIGQNLDFSLDFDENEPGNIYKWKKNGQFQFQTTGNNDLEINPVKATDAGIWTVEVTNPAAPDLTLFSKNITLNVAAPVCPATATFSSPTYCLTGNTYTLRFTASCAGATNINTVQTSAGVCDPPNSGFNIEITDIPLGTPVDVTVSIDCFIMSEAITCDYMHSFAAFNGPAVNISSTGGSGFCPGLVNTQLSVPTVGGASYQWKLNNSNIPGANSSSLAVNSPGQYLATWATPNGCMNESIALSLVEFTSPVAAISGNLQFCSGKSTTLTGEGGQTYSWSTGAGSPSIVTTKAETISVTATDSNGCTDSEMVTTDTFPKPAVKISIPALGNCTGTDIQLDETAGDATSWQWSGPGFTSSVKSPVRTNAQTGMSGNYTITVTENTNGCTNVASDVLTVYAPVDYSAKSNSPICVGEDLILMPEPLGGTAWEWFDYDGFTVSTDQTAVIVPVSSNPPDIYSLIITDVHGCTDLAEVTANILTAPTADFKTYPGTLSVQFENKTFGPATFLWTFGDGGTFSGPNPLPHSYAAAGTYEVCLYATNQCGTDSICQQTVISGGGVPGCNPTADSLELVKFFNAIGGPGWTNKTNWLVPGKKISEWYGVSVDGGGCVDSIILYYNGLTGSLIDFNLPNLQAFYCEGNQLSGSIPDFQKLPNLQTFNCEDNKLSDSIPDFQKLPNLGYFDCSSNELSGSIPDFQKLPNLGYFGCNFNELSGSIPDFQKLPNLGYFDCSFNELSGSIPDFQKLPNLGYFDCNFNELSDSIPDFQKLPNLGYFDCSFNELSGSIPDFQKLPNLGYFDCSINELSGSIPDFQKLPNLQTFDCSINQLSGSIPDFQKLSNLQVFDCGFNELNGSIPDFQKLPNLQLFVCHSNRLSGSIPDFQKLPNLQLFRCNWNRFTFENILSSNADIESITNGNCTPGPNCGYGYAPQDTVFHDTTLTRLINENLDFTLDFDENEAQNVYKWFKNGVFQFQTTGNNDLEISNIQPSHSGVWTVEVTNPGAPDLTLFSRKITLNVASAQACPAVSTTADSGPGSFREAIECANSHAGPDTIRFNIPGGGKHIFQLQSGLPEITDDGTVIDATTQPGWLQGSSLILDGSLFSVDDELLSVFGSASDPILGFELHGFILRNGKNNGLFLSFCENFKITKNAIYQNYLLHPDDGGNIGLWQCKNGLIQSNNIGLSEALLPQSNHEGAAIAVWGENILIGGNRAVGEGNNIGYTLNGILVYSNSAAIPSHDITIRGDSIFNCERAIWVDNASKNIVVGSDQANEANHILQNTLCGICIEDAGSDVQAHRNRFFCNAEGIQYEVPGPNAPVILSASTGFVAGTAAAGSTIRLFQHGDSACPNAVCQGKGFLSQTMADISGNWSLNGTFPLAAEMTATATLNGKTSPFSTCQKVCPTFSISVSGDTTICSGQTASLTLNLPATGGPFDVIYNDGTTDFTLNNIANGYILNLNPAVTTTYLFKKISDPGGCETVLNFQKTVVVSPPLSLTVNQQQPLTNPGAAMVDFPVGTPPFSLVWVGPPNGQMSNLPGPNYLIPNLPAGPPYSLTLTDANGCTTTQSFTISDCPLTISSAVAPDSCSEGRGKIDLSASSTASGSFSYLWSNGAMTQDLSGLVAGPSPTVTVTLTLASGGTCSATHSPIAIVATPTIVIGQGAIVCQPGDAFYTVGFDILSGAGPFQVNGQPLSGSSFVSTPIASGTAYSFDIEDKYGCSTLLSGIKNCKCTTPLQPKVTVSGGPTYCSDQLVQLSETSGQATSWKWSGPGGFSSTEQNPTVVLTGSGDFSVTITDADTCQGAVSKSISVNQSPVVDATGEAELCEKQPLHLKEIGGSTGVSWKWTGPGGFVSSLQNPPTVSQPKNGIYRVVVTAGSGCSAADSLAVSVHPEDLTELDSTICEGQNLLFDGKNLTKTGSYEALLKNRFGCDSLVRLTLVVNQGSIETLDDAATILPGETEIELEILKNDSLNFDGGWMLHILENPSVGTASPVGNEEILFKMPPGAVDFQDSLLYEICAETCPDLCDSAWARVVFLTPCFEKSRDEMPHGLSPDGLEKNRLFDPFFIFEKNGCPFETRRSSMAIVGRDGHVVWKRDPYEAWDGGEVPMATYYFMLRMRFEGTDDEVVLKGPVTLVRRK